MPQIPVSDELIAGYTDYAVGNVPHPQVRYTSGSVIYVESSDGDHWSGRFWSADGHIHLPYELWAEDAFRLEIDHQPLNSGWQWVSASEEPRTEGGARHLVIHLANTKQPLDVKVHTLLDGTPILTRWLEITNRSERPVALTAVAPWAGRLWIGWPGRMFTLGYYTKDTWACEGWFNWKTLPKGMTTIKCDKGQGFDDPFFIVRNEVTGEYFIGHLAWSANWQMDFQRDDKGLLFAIGPDARPTQRIIAPHETIATPSVHLGHVSGTLDTAVQAMHDHLRRSVLPARRPERFGLIQYLVPSDQGYYIPLDEAKALQCVDVAAAIGAELFLLDAGWWDVTLDWLPSTSRFPRGLEPIIQRVHEKGMLFGLYMEPETGRHEAKKSQIYQAHPDWFGPQDVLNLTIPEAAAWVEAEICRLVEQYHLDLLRIDYNPGFTYEGPVTVRDGLIENNYWRYYEVFYALCERLQKKYPALILQQCASGGARNDLGTASRFHETYLTDGLSLPRELQIYSGLTLGLPPEIFVILHGADGLQGMVGKPQNLDTILRMSYATSTPQIFVGLVAPSVKELSPQRRARFLHYGQLYKEFIRPLLPTCKMYHHEPVNAWGGVESGPWFATEYTSPDRAKGWALIVRLRNGAGDLYVHKYSYEAVDDREVTAAQRYENDTYLFRSRGLHPARTYRVTFDSVDTAVTIEGLRLLQEGLRIRLENAGLSELLLFEAI